MTMLSPNPVAKFVRNIQDNLSKLKMNSMELIKLGRLLSGSDLLFEVWRATSRYDDPRSLSRFDASLYSQNGEDGVIAEILRRIGIQTGFFVEIGIENGQENNTRLLLEQGWRGLWIEGSQELAGKAKAAYREFIAEGWLTIVHALVTAENINSILENAKVPKQFDFFSIDIDQNTSHVWRALRFTSRIACVEYNASLPPSIPLEVPYDPSAAWDRTNWFGASLKALELIGSTKEMKLVGCDLNGSNAFFVGASEVGDAFLSPFTAENHFEPARYYRKSIHRGHRRSTVPRRWFQSKV
jgi:hypothetical protein